MIESFMKDVWLNIMLTIIVVCNTGSIILHIKTMRLQRRREQREQERRC
jgi:hypothetical protein